MHKKLITAVFVVLAAWCSDVFAMFPPANHGLFVEAEKFKFDSSDWVKNDFAEKDGTAASSGAVICATKNDSLSAATVERDLAESDLGMVWVRFRNGAAGNAKQMKCNFVFSVDGKKIGDVTIDNGETSSGAGTLYSWGRAKLPALLPAGKLKIEMKSVGSSEAPMVDCIYLGTLDAFADEPEKIVSVLPRLYMRFVVEKDGSPMKLGGWAHNWTWKKQITTPKFGKTETKDGKTSIEFVKPGQASDWIDFQAAGEFHDEIMFYSIFPILAPLPAGETASIKYKVQFSTSRSVEDVFLTLDEYGKEAKIAMKVNVVTREMFPDWVVARETAEKIASLPPPKGKKPTKIPVTTPVHVSHLSDKVIDLELDSVSKLGFNSFGLGTPPEFFYTTGRDKGFIFLDSQRFGGALLDQAYKDCKIVQNEASVARKCEKYYEELKAHNMLDKVPFAILADEPHLSTEHIGECEYCKAQFPEFLRGNGVKPEEIKLEKLEDAVPARYPKDNPALHYWSMRYYTHRFSEIWKPVTAELKKYGLRTVVNFACQVVGNVLWDGGNWFEIYRNGGLSYGCCEDWFNLCNSYQFVGFQLAVMRSACEPAGVPYGSYCIAGRPAWEVGCKSFTHFARKIDYYMMFSYGPNYQAGDAFNHRDVDLFREVRDALYALGAVEDLYVDSKPVKGDVAMLYATTTDYWDISKVWSIPDSLYGLERSTLYLLLNQCHVRTDIIYEGDLAEKLADYKHLFAVDSHIKADELETIIEWVKNGGTLYMGPNALAKDEYDRMLDNGISLDRSKYTRKDTPRSGMFYGPPKPMGFLTINDKETQIPVYYGREITSGRTLATMDGEPILSEIKLGKGRIIMSGFFMGLSHFMRAKQTKGIKMDSVTDFPQDTLELMRKLKNNMGIKSYVETSDPLVEAHILTSKKGDLLVLSNWSGTMKDEITVKISKRYTKVNGVRTTATLKKTTGDCAISIKNLETGDFIVLE